MKIAKIVLLSLLATICAVAATVAVMHFTGFEFGRNAENADNRPNRTGSVSNTDEATAEDADSDIYNIPVNFDAFYDYTIEYDYDDASMVKSGLYEQGSFPIVAFSDPPIIIPIPVVPTILPPATVGQPYTVHIANPADAPAGMRLRWELTNPIPPTPPTNILPPGLEWLPGGVRGGIEIDGIPTTATEGDPAIFFFDLYDADEPDPDLARFGRYRFSLSVWAPGSDPAINIFSVTDAMVGFEYNEPFEILFSRPEQTWEFRAVSAGALPAGLSVEPAPGGSPTQFVITGTPTAVSPGPGAPPNFVINMQQTNTSLPNTQVYSVPLNIRVWDKPEISSLDLVPGSDTSLLPGIANINGVSRTYEAILNGNGPDVSPISTAWGWSVRPNETALPTGLRITTETSTANTISRIAGIPTAAATRNFTIRYTADPNVLQGYVEQDYSIEIFAPPYFTTGYDDLPPTMDTDYRYPGVEPEDPEYSEPVYAEGFDAFPSDTAVPETAIAWVWAIDGTMPPGLSFNSSVGNSRLIYGSPRTDTRGSDDYPFTVTITAVSGTASPGNKNIVGARISQPYKIRIWERRYLYIEITADGDQRRFVRRAGEQTTNPGANWDAPGWNGVPYRERRAVMPGTDGEIRVPLSNSGFVRWEVMPESYPEPNSNKFATIGGPDRYTATPGSTNAFLKIQMPAGTNDGDVYVRAVDTTPPHFSEVLNPGTVGDITSGGFISLLATDAGSGDNPISWELLSDPSTFPPGMDFFRGNNTVTMLTSIPPNGPTTAGIYTFTLGINLPGGMRVDKTFTFTVNAVPGVMLGDVDGNSVVDLRDLIMLARYVRGDISSMPNPRAGNIVTADGEDPKGSDLDVLARYFSRPDIALVPSSAP